MKAKVSSFLVPIAFVLALAPLPAAAGQTPAPQNPVTTAVQQVVARHGDLMVAAAQEMPADKFSYSPTPQQMTFGRLVLHVAQSNMSLCSHISGQTAPALGNLTPTSPKDDLVAAMKSSFDFCGKALAGVNDSQLSDQVEFFGGRKVSKAAAMIALADDLYDHYSQEAIYLRLNGHLPPSARRRGGM